MSIKNLEDSFTINNQTFVGIEELGFNERGSFVVHAYMTPPPNPRGTYTGIVRPSAASGTERCLARATKLSSGGQTPSD